MILLHDLENWKVLEKEEEEWFRIEEEEEESKKSIPTLTGTMYENGRQEIFRKLLFYK